MKEKLLIVYNTCGIRQNENLDYYIGALRSLLDQNESDHQIVISGCLHREEVKSKIKTALGNRIAYSFTSQKLPVNVTFNKTVQKAVEKFGDFKGYLFIDSGINFAHDKNAIKKLFHTHRSSDCGMTASRTNTDAGTFLWFNEGKNYEDESGQNVLFQNGDLEIPIGKTVNLHCQIFDHSIYENFDSKLIPDIFASHCTESVFSYLCAAVNKKFVVTKDVMADHLVGMDGPSSGFRPEINPFPAWQHTFSAPSPGTILKIISDPEALESGFGYEECQNILPHKKEKYTKEGKCIDHQRLRNFIKENLFLKPSFLDYNEIQCDFS